MKYETAKKLGELYVKLSLRRFEEEWNAENSTFQI